MDFPQYFTCFYTYISEFSPIFHSLFPLKFRSFPRYFYRFVGSNTSFLALFFCCIRSLKCTFFSKKNNREKKTQCTWLFKFQKRSFVQTFWVQLQSNTFVQIFGVQSKTFVQTFWMRSKIIQKIWVRRCDLNQPRNFCVFCL